MAGLRGLTLGAVAADLMPLLRPPQKPPLRPPLGEMFPVLPLFMNTPVFVYSDVVSRPQKKQ